MKSAILFISTFTLLAIHSTSIYGKTKPDSLITAGMTFELRNDTLVANSGLLIFVGQKFLIGNSTGKEGQYRSIISKKAAIVPSIWGQDKRYENAIENYVDSKKNKEKVKASLIPGNLLTIKSIKLSKVGKPHFYIASLSSPSDDYNCDIKLALRLGELLFP
ncbi:MAG: hypothetical protein J0I41_09030 [Filimonas sp.]|nr:hypothetical protein [Filimonas sp.]